ESMVPGPFGGDRWRPQLVLRGLAEGPRALEAVRRLDGVARAGSGRAASLEGAGRALPQRLRGPAHRTRTGPAPGPTRRWHGRELRRPPAPLLVRLLARPRANELPSLFPPDPGGDDAGGHRGAQAVLPG